MKTKILNLKKGALYTLVIFLFASCSNFDTTNVTDNPEVLPIVDAWICDMQSLEEDGWRYELYMRSNGNYVAVSDTRITKVTKDGFLESMILMSFDDDDVDIMRVYNDKIYRFHYNNDFQVFDPTEPLKLQVYDFDFNLLSEQILDSNGLIYDVEIENDDTFGMLVYDPDENTMTLKKIHRTDGLLADIDLSTSGTSPTNLHIVDNGLYMCTASSNKNNFFMLDNNLNILWAKEFNDYTINDANYIDGQGIYISGRVTPFADPERPTYVALIDFDGNEINSVRYDPGERWGPYMQVNDDKICLTQTEPESGINMLMTILDYNLNIESTLEIPGNIVQSDIIVNELGSFSFVYGNAIDPDDPDFFPEVNNRIFKFDTSYELPSMVIVQ